MSEVKRWRCACGHKAVYEAVLASDYDAAEAARKEAERECERLRILLMTCNLAADGSSETDEDPAVQVAKRVGELIVERDALAATVERVKAWRDTLECDTSAALDAALAEPKP